jgi:hypothetical protein
MTTCNSEDHLGVLDHIGNGWRSLLTKHSQHVWIKESEPIQLHRWEQSVDQTGGRCVNGNFELAILVCMENLICNPSQLGLLGFVIPVRHPLFSTLVLRHGVPASSPCYAAHCSLTHSLTPTVSISATTLR